MIDQCQCQFCKKQRLEDVIQAAQQELEREHYREAVEKAKQRLRSTKWWHRFIPIITITWRNK